jgi:hypothetical protein
MLGPQANVGTKNIRSYGPLPVIPVEVGQSQRVEEEEDEENDQDEEEFQISMVADRLVTVPLLMRSLSDWRKTSIEGPVTGLGGRRQIGSC